MTYFFSCQNASIGILKPAFVHHLVYFHARSGINCLEEF